MNYWHIQLHPNNQSDFPPEKIVEILKKKSVIGLGVWDEGEDYLILLKDRMQINDIVLVRNGKTPIALVKVIDNYEYTENTDKNLDWFEHRRKVKILDIYDGSDEFPQPRGTLQILLEQNQTTSWKFIDNYYKRVSKKKNE